MNPERYPPCLEAKVKNYGEELGYWYFRLNGFFPITDFVLHRDSSSGRTSDADVLAVRPPFVDERIGGANDVDVWLTPHLQCGVGVICQIKTGRYTARSVFRTSTLHTAVERLGLVADISGTSRSLETRDSLTINGTHFTKVLIADIDRGSATPARFLSINEVNRFIVRRMQQFTDRQSDRHFFPSSLLQYIIHFRDQIDVDTDMTDGR